MKIVFSDFDGTLTVGGRLGATFFEVLDLISKNNSELVVVSGRSLSWGHFLLTHFPLKYVIMEGGGVIAYQTKDGMIKEENLVDRDDILELERITADLVKTHPECILSADSMGRRTDRAIEFGLMDPESVVKVEKYLDMMGANFSRSNVHINFWVGDVSKSRAVKYFMKNYTPHVNLEECIFYGDSLNDESMFEHFQNTVGVSNILSILDQLTFKPKIVLEGKDNSGCHGVLAHLKQVFDQSINF